MQITSSKGFSTFAASILEISLGLVLGFIVILIANPKYSPLGFSAVLFCGFKKIGDIFYYATPILMTGLSVDFAFEMGLFNISASEQ